MEQVKRLAGNEIELGMWIPTIESRASNIPMDKGNYACCHNIRPIKIFVEYVGDIVLKPVGSARLTFDNDLYYVMCFGDQSLFGVPDEITDMTSSLKLVET